MERDVNSYHAARAPDARTWSPGWPTRSCYNYINRVVRGRKIGECIFFQGGTAYNDAVAAAFAAILGKEIIVPPHNGVIGAHRRGPAGPGEDAERQRRGRPTLPRLRPGARSTTRLREFTCKGCSNYCDDPGVHRRGREDLLGRQVLRPLPQARQGRPRAGHRGPGRAAARKLLLTTSRCRRPRRRRRRTVGIPLAMYAYELLPVLADASSRELGCRPVLSAETDRKTIRSRASTPSSPSPASRSSSPTATWPTCVEQGGRLHLRAEHRQRRRRECTEHRVARLPLGPDAALRRSAGRRRFETVRGHDSCALASASATGDETRPQRPGRALARPLGVERSGRRPRRSTPAYAAQRRFRRRCSPAGREALDALGATGEPGIVLVGRPYNIHDAGVNLDVPRKLRDYYGVNVHARSTSCDLDGHRRPRHQRQHVLELRAQDPRRRPASSADDPNLHIIYITNFKCGPDSFIKHFIARGLGQAVPDACSSTGTRNDAGMMTRCEAYLDSKGILRWWSEAARGE